jgi:hypothetical protein
VPHLIKLDHHRPTFWLGLLRVGGADLPPQGWSAL